MPAAAKSLLGGALLGQKKYAEAEPLLLLGYEGMKRPEADVTPRTSAFRKERLAEALKLLVGLYEGWGKDAEATRWRKEL